MSMNSQPPSDNDPGQPTSDITDAKKPFDSSAKADIILRSSDSVDFFVLRSFLSFVSPTFDDMFSLHHGEATKGTDSRNGLYIVPLTEDSVTLYNLLLLIYPYMKQPTEEIGVIVNMARAARKYIMDEIDGKLRRVLAESTRMTEEPLRAFAVAMHFGWTREAKMAAWNLLATPSKDLGQCGELDLITGTDYQMLVKWRLKCHEALYGLLSKWYTGSYTERHGRSVSVEYLAGLLLDRLRSTNCPRSNIILDDSTLVKALKNIKVCEVGFNPRTYIWHDLDSKVQDWALEEMIRLVRSMKRQIDDLVFKIPFEIKSEDA